MALEVILLQIGVKCKNRRRKKRRLKSMLQSGDIKHKRDIAISRLTNSRRFFVETCFIIDYSGIIQGKNKYRLLAFHESKKRIFIDKYYPTLRGARIAFKRQFKNMACIDNVSFHWSQLYQPERDWIDERLSFVENMECN